MADTRETARHKVIDRTHELIKTSNIKFLVHGGCVCSNRDTLSGHLSNEDTAVSAT